MRAQIARQAFTVFHKRGFEAVTVAELTSSLGISRASFFRYFESKEEAVFWGLEGLGADLAAALAARPAVERPWMALRGAFAETVDRMFSNRDEARARIAMIDATASLRQHYAGLRESWRGEVARVLAERMGAGGARRLSRFSARLRWRCWESGCGGGPMISRLAGRRRSSSWPLMR